MLSKKNILSYGDVGVMFFLAVYFVVSFTDLPSSLALSPLIISGLLLLVEVNSAHGDLPPKRDRVAIWVMGFFLVSYAASVIFSENFLKSVNAFAVIFPGLLIAYILNQISTENLRYVLLSLNLLVLSCASTCIFMFLHSVNFEPALVFREGGTATLVVPNDLLAGVIFLPIVAFTLAKETLITIRLLAAATAAAIVVAIIMVDSRTCYITAIFMTILYFFCFLKKGYFLSALFLLLILCTFDNLLRLGITDNFYALRTENARLSIWLAGLAHWGDNPVLGFGPSNFEDAYLLGIRELVLPDWVMIESRRIPWAHNLYIEALIERGIVGLTALASLLVLIFIRMRTHWKWNITPVSDFYIALFISFSGFIFAGFFESTMQRTWVANSLFIFIGLSFSPLMQRADNTFRDGYDIGHRNLV